MLRKIAIVLSLLLVAACGFQKGETEIIPRQTIFGNADKNSVTISPNGQYIAYIAPYEGVLNIFIAPTNDPGKEAVITQKKGRGIRSYIWAYDNQHIVYGYDNNGDENVVLYSVNIDTKKVKQITESGAKSGVVQGSHKYPQEMLIQTNARSKEFFDLYKVNVATGASELVYQNDQYIALIEDDDFKLRFSYKKLPDNGTEIYEFDDKKNAKLYDTVGPEEADLIYIAGFDKTGKKMYMFDSRLDDKVQLVEVDIKTKQKTLIFKNKNANMTDVLVHPTENTIQAGYATYARNEWQFLDPRFKADFEFLDEFHTGEPVIVSRSLDDQHWIIAFNRDNGPIDYYYYKRDSRNPKFLFSHQKALTKYKLPNMEPVFIKSRDGFELVSYLTRPVESSSVAVPLVLLVHGGPSARDDWGFDPLHQWLANRGYAVLSVNYRGSTGFGKKFFNAGHGEWAAKMHDDLLDAVQWAIDSGITTKDKVAIMGISYGGYATLVGLTFTPDVFACGIDIVGISNLITFQQSAPPYWKPAWNFMIKLTGGDSRTEEGRKFLLSRSPITFADRIRKPLLIGHGQNDVRVKRSESDEIVEKMRKYNIPVTYILYPDEGHGFIRPANKISFFAIAEQFLAKNLGGKAEPIGNDMEDSSYQVIEDSNGIISAQK